MYNFDEAVKLTMTSFDRFKTPGPDNTYPAIYQESLTLILPFSKASTLHPFTWRKVRVGPSQFIEACNIWDTFNDMARSGSKNHFLFT